MTNGLRGFRGEMLRELQADYVMVVFGGFSGYAGDDLNKLVRSRVSSVSNVLTYFLMM